MNKNMTALISLYARVYHSRNSNIRIYNEVYYDKLLSPDEYNQISQNMQNGINFFNPNYRGDNPLKWIVNNNLAPSVLARSAFNEKHLLNEINLGLKQYIILASGYDTSGFKVNNQLKVFELDKKEMIEDKLNRIKNAKLNTKNISYIKTDFNKNWINELINSNYKPSEKTFCSMLGISYYLDKKVFKKTIKELSGIIPKGSSILFDYPNTNESKTEKINQQLAKGANEEMKSTYSYKDIESIAEESNLLIYAHLNHMDINNNYFYDYNTINPTEKIIAPIGISYVILVKK
ncbi:MAG: class I SAM-dependent methyltransferase [Bacilli bacterium]|nr:class I SAM-dependent methyltransferase [Bacilli bacterium]